MSNQGYMIGIHPNGSERLLQEHQSKFQNQDVSNAQVNYGLFASMILTENSSDDGIEMHVTFINGFVVLDRPGYKVSVTDLGNLDSIRILRRQPHVCLSRYDIPPDDDCILTDGVDIDITWFVSTARTNPFWFTDMASLHNDRPAHAIIRYTRNVKKD